MTCLVLAYWMTFTMTGKDGTSIITVECAQTDQDNPPSDIEKVCNGRHYTSIPLYYYTSIPLYHYTIIPLYHYTCTIIPLH